MTNLARTLPALVLTFAASAAFAHPGGHSLTCKSAAISGSKQKLEFSLSRSNGTGWYAPAFELKLNGKVYSFNPPDEMQMYGETFHDSPLGVITVTADNTDDGEANQGSFRVIAAPGSVKTFDTNGKPVKWSFKAEKDECNDSNGKATFKGLFRGYLRTNAINPNQSKDVPLDVQMMDCELTYDSGMAC